MVEINENCRYKVKNNKSVEAKVQIRGHHEMVKIHSPKFIEILGGHSKQT